VTDVTTWPPSTDQILDLVAGGVLLRSDRYRFDLLDALETPIGEVHPDLEANPKVGWDTTRTVMRSLESIRLSASEAGDINPTTDRLRPVMVLQNGAEFPLGVFLGGDVTQPERAWGDEHQSQWVDKGHILTFPYGKTTGSPKGANVVQRAVDYARTAFNLSDIDAEPHPAVLKAPLGWGIDDTLGAIIDAHLALVGYLPVHVNRAGRVQIQPAPTDLDLFPATLDFEAGGRVQRDSIVKSDDLLQAPNEFVVYDQSGANTPIRGVYRIPETAPHSVTKRGYVVRRTESMTGLATPEQANTAAKALATTDRKSTFRWRTWRSSGDPRPDTFDVVRFMGDNYLHVAWAMELRPGGLMDHQARRVY
jgi:hypothetical protein